MLVITGAGVPLAAAIARRAAREGAHLVLVDQEYAHVTGLSEHLRRLGAVVLTIVPDGGDPRSHERVRGDVERAFGRVDAWINVPRADVQDLSAWTALALDALAVGGGTLVNVGDEAYRSTARARRHVRREASPINVCLVRYGSRVDDAVVAHSALSCLRHPRREVVIGAATQVLTALDRLFRSRVSDRPRLNGQRVAPVDRGALRRATRGGPRAAKSNVYGLMLRHPWTSLAVAGAAALFFGGARAHAPTMDRPRVNP